MSLRPVKRSRRHSQKHPRLQTGSGQWNFSWKPVRHFEPSKHKKGILVIILIFLASFAFVWGSDQNNPLTHSIVKNPDYKDPSNVLWQETFGSNDLSGLNCNRATFVNDGSGQLGATLASDNNGPAACLFKSSLDMSTVGQKSIWFQMSAINSGVSFNFEWFLTKNATLTGVGPDSNYKPENDPNVVLIHRLTGQGGGAYLENVLMQREATVAIGNGQYPSCQAGSGNGVCYMVTTQTVNIFPTIILSLNFTGGNPISTSGSWVSINGSTFAQYLSRELPWLQFQAVPYYMGFFVQKGAGNSVDWITQISTHTINGVNYEMCSTIGGECMSMTSYILTTAATPTLDTGGFFGPVIKALINIGVFILNALLSFISFITPALQAALNFLEGILVAALNGLGNALGLGNVGTSLQQLINSLITFFANGQFANIMSNIPTAFSRLIDLMSVYFPWLPSAITIGLNVAAFAINGISFALTVLADATLIGVGVVATILIVLFFVYTGDNALGGVLEFWETTVWLVVGLGLKFLSHLANFILDVVTAIIGVIPKPFVQMVAHALPRIPIIEVEARFIQPSGLMGEIQNGNLFAVALWISGLLFTDLFESASPALPGSIGALIPSAAPALVALKGLTSLLAIMTVFVWIAAIFVVPIGWFSNAMDLGVNLPFESSLGNRPSSHLGIRIRKGEKHNVKASLGQLRNVFRREKPRPESKPDENIN